MSEISTGAVVDGITLALRAAFPDSFIAVGTVEQGLERPAFIVQELLSGESDLPCNWLRRHTSFVVHYFPDDDGAGVVSMGDVGDALFRVLKLITLPGGDKLRCSDMSFESDDGVLHFSVGYKYNAVFTQGSSKMESLEVKQHVQ